MYICEACQTVIESPVAPKGFLACPYGHPVHSDSILKNALVAGGWSVAILVGIKVSVSAANLSPSLIAIAGNTVWWLLGAFGSFFAVMGIVQSRKPYPINRLARASYGYALGAFLVLGLSVYLSMMHLSN